MPPNEVNAVPQGAAGCSHLWEYRWGGLYRRCQRKACRTSEWNYGDNHYEQGRPCSISMYHELSARAVNGTKVSSAGVIGEIKRFKVLRDKYLKEGNKNLADQYQKFIDSFERPLKGGIELTQIEKDIERGYFLRQKELAKTW